MSEWKQFTIGDLVRIHRGITWSKHQELDSPEPNAAAVLRIPNIQERLNTEDLLHISGVSHQQLQQYAATKNWILMVGSNGNPKRVGNCVLIRDQNNFLFASFLVGIESHDVTIADPEFTYFLLRGPKLQKAISDSVQGTTGLRNISLNQLRIQKVNLPPLPEQRKIASILTTVDRLIEQTEALIEKYRRVKQGMMADLLSRGVDEHGKLRPTQKQAPQLYKQSELGWIPKEWEVERVANLLIGRPKNGYSPIEADAETGAYILGLSCLRKDGFAPVQLKNAPVGDPKLQGARLRDGDLLISRSNTIELVGLVGRYTDVGVPCYYPDLMMRLTPNDSILPEFMETILRFDPVRRQLTNASCGTSGSMKKINSTMVLGTSVVLPSKGEQDVILSRISPMVTLCNNNETHLAKLRTLKTGLMQDLLTGKVRVKVDQDEETTADV